MSDAFLRTERLLLRPHRRDDAPFMVALNADPEVVRYTGDGSFASLAEAEAVVAALEAQFAARRLGRLVVVERDTGVAVGWCGLRWHAEEQAADLGFRFFRRVWGRGYATEAGRACLDWADGDGQVGRVFAGAMPANLASVRVLHKLGFRETGRIDDDGFAMFERRSTPS